jgi:hypothetical protein
MKNLPAGDYVLVCKEIVEQRSTNQNRLYWLWLTMIADETGHAPNEMHEYFRMKFLKCHDKKFEYIRSTTDLNKDEFTKYLNQIELFATTELNITLPADV